MKCQYRYCSGIIKKKEKEQLCQPEILRDTMFGTIETKHLISVVSQFCVAPILYGRTWEKKWNILGISVPLFHVNN